MISNTRRLAVAILLSSLPLAVYPQKPKTSPDEKPRTIKKELKKAYVDWIRDVEPIITDEERSAWKRLRTDEEREQFIMIFWDHRDPDPDTKENEYKEQYFERVAYADEHFSSGKLGRFMDRGRIYIKFGKPDEVESHPSGGSYERPSYEGGGSTTSYPFEKWFYRHIPNVRSGVELEFVDPSGSGEYRLARNPDEKDALLHVPGAGLTLGERLGIDSKADRIASIGGFGRVNYMRAQDSPFEVQSLLADLDRVQPVERRWFDSRTGTPIVEDNPLAFEAELNYFRLSDNQVLIVLTLQAENRELVFENVGGLETARLNITGNITSITEKRLGRFEDSVATRATPHELSEVRSRKSAYAKTFILQPGRYRADIMVRDVSSGATGIQRIGFQVPTFPTNTLATSSIVLAAKLENMDGNVGSPFMIGTTKVIPNLSATYTRGQPAGIYLQVYNAAIDQTTLRPAVDVEYILLRDGKELHRQSEDWREVNDAGQRLTLTRLIDTRSLEPGKYQIQININDRITGQNVSPIAKFTIVP